VQGESVVTHAVRRRLAILSAGLVAFALLTSCASSRVVTEHSNPDYVGKSFKSLMVVAVTADEIVRRTFEDRVVVLLARRGVKGIPAYAVLSKRGRVEEAELRQAVAGSGAEGVLLTRVTRVERSGGTVAGSTMAIGIGTGLYGYYSGVWTTVNVAPQTISGPSTTMSQTRLFDARNGALAWAGMVDTDENNDLDAALTQYINVIFDAMVHDRVL
jgi:hypothetical protein